MKRSFIFFAFILLASCAPVPVTYRSSLQNIGDDAERHLTSRYNDVSVNCGRDSKPAFLCTGIVIRGTSYKAGRHSWNNSPDNHSSGGVSFSFLRKDSKYTKLAYGYVNGYIFLPYDNTESGMRHPQILCSFPIDAATSSRFDHGCGAYPGVSGSGPCQSQSIYTETQWYTHYRSTTGNPRTHQCGFDVRNYLDERATSAFNASIKAMALLGSESFATQNELRLAVWPENSGSTLPLEAFFYIDGSSQGRSDAQSDQKDLYATDRVVIPVISARFPANASGSITFKYLAGDQAVALP